MKVFQGELNTKALDTALTALFMEEGRDNVKRVYEAVLASMELAHAEGQRSSLEGVEVLRAEGTKKANEARHEAYWKGVSDGIASEQEAASADKAEVTTSEVGPAQRRLFPTTGIFGDDDRGVITFGRDSGDEQPGQ